MLHRIGGLYLWIALILASVLMDVRTAARVGALLIASTVHLALLVAAVWVSGARKTEAGRVRERTTFLPALLLMAFAVALVRGGTRERRASSKGTFATGVPA